MKHAIVAGMVSVMICVFIVASSSITYGTVLANGTLTLTAWVYLPYIGRQEPPTLTLTPTSRVTPTATPTATLTNTLSPTSPATLTPTDIPTPTVTPTSTPRPTLTATPTHTPTPSPTPCATISWVISAPTTLTSGCTYLVTGNTLVDSHASLIIQPGVTIKFVDSYYLQIDGYLESIGTPSDPIMFTSAKQDPIPCSWNGIVLRGPSRHKLYYTVIIEPKITS